MEFQKGITLRFDVLHRVEAVLRKPRREHDKKRLYKVQKKVKISLALVKVRLRLGLETTNYWDQDIIARMH